MYDEVCMYFHPASFRIEVFWSKLKRLPNWRRQTIGLFAHELVHIYQWLVMFRQDALRWNEANEQELERQAGSIQDIVLKLLRVD